MPNSKKSKITDEHLQESVRLKALWDDGRPHRTQAVFGEVYGLGNQANVGHYLNGRSPLNPKAAAAFAAELRCSVSEFSPRVAKELARLSGMARPQNAPATPTLSPTPAPGDAVLLVPLLANTGSMGCGNDVLCTDVIVGNLALSPHWINQHIKPANPQELRFIHAHGESMAPTFTDGDVLLVDVGSRDPSSFEGVYVLEVRQKVYIKRVRMRMDGQLEVSSDNTTIKTVDVLNGDHEVNVLGRVVWAWNGRKL